MHTSNLHREDTTVYWNLIKNVSDDVKLRLISLLSQSMTPKKRRSRQSEKEATREFLSKYCGVWEGDLSAEEIISAIQDSRTYKDPVSFD